MSVYLQKPFLFKSFFKFLIIYLIAAFILLLIDFTIIIITVIYYVWLFVIIFLVYFSITFFILKIKSQNYNRLILKDLPFFLNNLANDLDRNMSLKIALENKVDNSIIGMKVKNALSLVKKGHSLENALYIVSKDSYDLSRTFNQLIDILSVGSKNKATNLRLLAESITEEQNYLIKKYATKLNLITLIFVIVSAVVPAMFLMFLLVASNFLEITFSSLTVIVVSVVLFPLIDMFLLLIMKSNNP